MLHLLISLNRLMIGPAIPAHLLAGTSSSHQDDESSDSESGPTPIGPQIPPTLTTAPKASTTPPPYPPPEEEEEDEDDYAPTLPPELAAARASTAKRVIGPALPSAFAAGPRYDEDDDDDDDVGPRPVPQGIMLEEKSGVEEFLEREERRRKRLEVSSIASPPACYTLAYSIHPCCCSFTHSFYPWVHGRW